ncbi:MAG: hypothetical protein FGM24_01485 [Candidatus Kapabacteria bacterium]|nr:hypothetical protein [Candidatus Kapabacteria bacterium]
MFRIAPCLILALVAVMQAAGQGVDTLRVPTGADVQFMVEGGGRVVMVSGQRAYHRAMRPDGRDTTWQRLPYMPRTSSSIYVNGDTVVLVDAADSCRITHNAGMSWQSTLAVPNVLAVVHGGRVVVAIHDCEGDLVVMSLYDVEADTVRYLSSPIPCTSTIDVASSAESCWIAAYASTSGAAPKGDVWRIDMRSGPIGMWEPEYDSLATYVTTMRDGRVGRWQHDTLRSVSVPVQTMVLPYPSADLGYPLDVMYASGRWYIVMPSGIFTSVDGLAWQRNAAMSARMPLRCWATADTTALCSKEGFGPFTWNIPSATASAFNTGLVAPLTTEPLLGVNDLVVYADSWVDIASRGMVIWGDAPAPSAVVSVRYGDEQQRRSTVYRGRVWTYGGESTMSFDVATRTSRVEVTGQPVYAVTRLGNSDVIWQGRDLKIRRDGSSQWESLRTIVTNDGADGQILGIAGTDRVVVVVALAYDQQSDRMFLRSYACDSTGEELTGWRLLTLMEADVNWRTFDVRSAGAAVVVWTGDAAYITDDDGTSWTLHTPPFASQLPLASTSDGLAVWSPAPQALWVTADAGRTWTRTVIPMGIDDVRSVATTPGYYHLLTPEGVIRVPRVTTGVDVVTPTSDEYRPVRHGSELHVSATAPCTMKLVDMQGRAVRISATMIIDMDGLAQGMYHCIVESPHTVTVTQVTVCCR